MKGERFNKLVITALVGVVTNKLDYVCVLQKTANASWGNTNHSITSFVGNNTNKGGKRVKISVITIQSVKSKK